MAQRPRDHRPQDPQRSLPPARLVIIGAGPRAIGVLERFAASAAELRGRQVEIDLVDPCMPGAGRIWSTDESPLLLMNSRARDVTVFTDDSVVMDGPVVPGPTLAEWAEEIRSGHRAAPTASTSLRAEIDELGADAFASRRVQALYLEWFFGHVLAALPTTVRVHLHREEAVALRRVDASSWRVRLAGGAELPADAVLLALGHTDALPGAADRANAEFARRHGGAWIGPSQARDADLDSLPAGEDVIVRGMGLAFIDLMALLTEGRGGRFEPDPCDGEPGRLVYVPSGREPRLWVGSRRGVPFHSKVRGESEPAGPRDLVHVTAQALDAREDATGHLDYARDVLPLIASEIARAVPELAVDPAVDPAAAWLDDPLRDLVRASAPDTAPDAASDTGPDTEPDDVDRRRALDTVRDEVVSHVEADLAARAVGPATAERALFQTLLRIHGVLAEHLPSSRLTEDSRHRDAGRWFSLFSFVDSGPPPHRLQQLLALERAGVVRFLGPRVRVTTDERTGRFVARGGAGTVVAARALVDAFLPAAALATSASELLRSLVGDEPIGVESASSPGRLAVDDSLRVLGPDGAPHEGLWAVGPGTSELQVGAFARPRTNAPSFRRNDALARALACTLADVGTPHAPRRGRTGTPVLGILGTGKLGTALARTALRRGFHVEVGSRLPDDLVRTALPGARRDEIARIADRADAVILALPLHAALQLDPDDLAGAVVIDATNAWGSADEDALAAARRRAAEGPRSGAPGTSTSELLAAHLRRSAVVKSLNHLGYHDIEELRVTGRAVALAGDDPAARATVAAVLARLGADPVDLGPLARGVDLEPGAALFDGWTTRAQLAHRRSERVAA